MKASSHVLWEDLITDIVLSLVFISLTWADTNKGNIRLNTKIVLKEFFITEVSELHESELTMDHKSFFEEALWPVDANSLLL